MSKAKLDGESRLRDYFIASGLRVERFTKAELRQGRTPDFKVFAGDELAFYCEVKTAQEDEWLDKQLAAAPPGTLVGGSRPDPTYNRLCNYINNAVDQLDAVNPAMDRPNVLAIVNGDDGAGLADLIQVLTANAYCESGEVIPMFREYSEGRIPKTKLRAHLYLWFNEWQAGDPQKFFPEVHADHHAALSHHFRVNPAELKRLPPAATRRRLHRTRNRPPAPPTSSSIASNPTLGRSSCLRRNHGFRGSDWALRPRTTAPRQRRRFPVYELNQGQQRLRRYGELRFLKEDVFVGRCPKGLHLHIVVTPGGGTDNEVNAVVVNFTREYVTTIENELHLCKVLRILAKLEAVDAASIVPIIHLIL